MIHSKSFVKEPGNENSHPLRECYDWALEHCQQRRDNDEGTMNTPMLMFVQKSVHEHSNYVTRRYYASTLESFLRFYSGHGSCDTERHFDEVVGCGPCKAFLDFDLDFGRETPAKFGCQDIDELCQKAEDATSALISAIVEYHRHSHAVCVEPIIMKAHRPGRKWSKHVVFRGSLWHDVT